MQLQLCQLPRVDTGGRDRSWRGKRYELGEVRGAPEQVAFYGAVKFAGFGEPLLNPHIFEIIAESANRGKATTVDTNGTLLGEQAGVSLVNAELNGLSFSIDSAKPHTFERPRSGAHFQQSDVSNTMWALSVTTDDGLDLILTYKGVSGGVKNEPDGLAVKAIVGVAVKPAHMNGSVLGNKVKLKGSGV